MSGPIDRLVYEDPDPEAVLRLLDSHGIEAIRGRWHWIPSGTLAKIAQAGRELRRSTGGAPSRGARRRTTTPEIEERAIAAAREAGSLTHAARVTGLSYGLVRTLHRERGLPIPRMSPLERSAKGAATRRARSLLSKDPAHA